MVEYYISDNVLEEFYTTLEKKITSRFVHIPVSDVFYVRAAIKAATGVEYSLDRVERAMLLEGFLSPHDCFEPERKREWEYQSSTEPQS